uniref:NADH-ubiquinone oxidoreductase chain 2 n=1 Tax=Neotrigonia margaritacea TaxID=47539 RepID=A0A1X9JHZ2_9BIVA|nr:NADH dehydrogenase subunit 2 [Neotrigonia margaritacea]AQT38489.1 NADH dehydrogenase subunit 2 [Neotrigonia margaritacea]
MKPPYKSVFLSLMMLGTLLTISSPNWMGMWMGLEINMLGFIPLIYATGTTSEAESSVKYLIPQALGSSILLTGALLSSGMETPQILVTLAILLKLGVAPFHFWFPSVMGALNLAPAFLLLTWQKLAPLFVLVSLSNFITTMVIMTAAISALWGGIGGLNQTDIRALLSYSSITHLGWMMASLTGPAYITVAYITIYTAINSAVFLALIAKSLTKHKQLTTLPSDPITRQFLVLAFLSLAGLPPLMGFAMKAMVLLSTSASFPVIVSLIVGSLVSLYYYLTLSFSSLLSPQKQTPLMKTNYGWHKAILAIPQLLFLPIMLFLL